MSETSRTPTAGARKQAVATSRPAGSPQPDGPKPEAGRVIVAAVAPEGRRRAGLAFARSGTEIDLAEISQEQWAAIVSDPLLTVRPARSAPAED